MLQDVFGTPITVGAVISYCSRRGAGMWLTIGVVTAVESGKNSFGKSVPVLTVDRVSEVSTYEYSTVDGRLQAIHETLIFKSVTLRNPNYITVIPNAHRHDVETRFRINKTATRTVS
jgi:hypothetical protein